MSETSKNIAIGSLVLAAVAVLVWILLFLHPSFGDGELKLHVRFDNIDKVSVGSRVTYAGKPVGKVVQIHTIPEEFRTEGDPLDPIYTYDLTLAIDSKIKLYNCDEISLGTSGLMGERFISIVPKRPKNNPARLLLSDEVVVAVRAMSAEDTFEEINTAARKAQQTIEILASLLEQNREDLKATLLSIKSASQEFDTLMQQTNAADISGTFKRTAEQLTHTLTAAETIISQANDSQVIAKVANTLTHLETMTSSLNVGGGLNTLLTSANTMCESINSAANHLSSSIPKVDDAITHITNASQKADTLVARISSGEGSFGKLLSNDDFYLKTVFLMSKLNVLMDDVNQYGVLFHLDKSWQRDRKKRIEELTRLNSPEEFKGFLSSEMAKMNTSISQIGHALDKAESIDSKQAFKNMYADLLHQIQDFESTLKAYSLHVSEPEEVADNN